MFTRPLIPIRNRIQISRNATPKQNITKFGFFSRNYTQRNDNDTYINFEVHPRVLEQLKDPRLAGLSIKLDKDSLLDLANNPNGHAFYNIKNGYICYIQQIDNFLIRITTPMDEFKIISVGPIRQRNLMNSIRKRRYTPDSSNYEKLFSEEITNSSQRPSINS